MKITVKVDSFIETHKGTRPATAGEVSEYVLELFESNVSYHTLDGDWTFTFENAKIDITE